MALEKIISSRYLEQKLSDLALADDIAQFDSTEEQIWNDTLLRDMKAMFQTTDEAMHVASTRKNYIIFVTTSETVPICPRESYVLI